MRPIIPWGAFFMLAKATFPEWREAEAGRPGRDGLRGGGEASADRRGVNPMTHSRQSHAAPIGAILARHVLPTLQSAQFPLRISCIGTASYEGSNEADGFDHIVVIGECPSPEEAMSLAGRRLAGGNIHIGTDDMLRLRPRMIVIQDCDQGLVLAGTIRAGIILWQQPVASDAEARQIETEASKLRGAAFAAAGRGEHGPARDYRYRAGQLEARLVDALWRETAAELLRLPLAA